MKLVQGLRDQKVRARLRDSEFRPFAYVPSTRALIPPEIPTTKVIRFILVTQSLLERVDF